VRCSCCISAPVVFLAPRGSVCLSFLENLSLLHRPSLDSSASDDSRPHKTFGKTAQLAGIRLSSYRWRSGCHSALRIISTVWRRRRHDRLRRVRAAGEAPARFECRSIDQRVGIPVRRVCAGPVRTQRRIHCEASLPGGLSKLPSTSGPRRELLFDTNPDVSCTGTRRHVQPRSPKPGGGSATAAAGAS